MFARLTLLPALAASLPLLPMAALANDGFGGMTATGLTFGQTDAIAMVEEDLFISPDKITVDYLFRNTTALDVTGKMIFPLPPVDVQSALYGMFHLPDDLTSDNLVGFTAVVDGQPVKVSVDRIAVLEPAWDERGSLAAQYDTPGRDVTALLTRHEIPLTLDAATLTAALEKLSPEAIAALDSEGVLFSEGESGAALYPTWSLVYRYHWTQTFPAGADLRVHHSYVNYPPGGVFSWQDPPTEDYHTQTAEKYCIDAATSRGIMRVLSVEGEGADRYGSGMSYDLSYVLRTANSWAGPIGKFRLTLDKGQPDALISFCGEGVTKTGPTTFVMEKQNYTPEADLEILLIQGP